MEIATETAYLTVETIKQKISDTEKFFTEMKRLRKRVEADTLTVEADTFPSTELTDIIVEDARSNVRILKRLVFFQVLIHCNRLNSTNLISLRSKLQI